MLTNNEPRTAGRPFRGIYNKTNQCQYISDAYSGQVALQTINDRNTVGHLIVSAPIWFNLITGPTCVIINPSHFPDVGCVKGGMF